MAGAALLMAMLASVPSTREVRYAAYVGANGGICGERPCRRDPNIAQVRRVHCRKTDVPGEAACDYELRTRGTARWEQISDTFYRAPNGKRWYLDDNDEDDDDKARR